MDAHRRGKLCRFSKVSIAEIVGERGIACRLYLLCFLTRPKQKPVRRTD